MAYNEASAERVRLQLESDPRFVEKRMFGGIGFLLYGNMCVGVWKDNLIVRVGPDNWQDALSHDDVEEFNITGRSMRGWVMVTPVGFDTEQQLQYWLDHAIQFTQSLPPKPQR